MGAKATRTRAQDKALAPVKYRKIYLSKGGESYGWRISLEWGCPKTLSCLWEEKSLLKGIQEAQNISLILKTRSKQS